ncbi:MAG: arylsulfotransferase family protein [Aquisalimonadaceae bacterium]
MQRKSDLVALIAFMLAVAFLAFLAGALVAVTESAPSGYIRDAYRAGTALLEKRTFQATPYATDLWKPARSNRRGVTVHDPERATHGLTLYTSGHAAAAFLVDMDGAVVHRWERPYSSIWDDTAAARKPVPDRQIYFRRARMYPNGDLLAVYDGVGDSPYGYGMVRLDRNSDVLWKNLDHFHHDVAIAENGHIHGLTHAFRETPPAGLEHLSRPVLDDYLTIVSPVDGRTLRKISLLEAVNRSEFRRQLWSLPFYTLGDPLHTNAVDVLGREDAERLSRKVPVAAQGQVLLSFRELGGGTIALLDVERESIVWALHGSWRSQHDPDILANGNILLFDNFGHYGEEGRSRVIEVDPATGGIVWQYAGTTSDRLESLIRSAQQPLPNGNVLITESDGGRLLEVSRDGDVVWEYINPVRGGDDQAFIPVVSWGLRIDPAELGTAFSTQVIGQPPSRTALDTHTPRGK